jgi:Protein of unknown function (DUF1501)
MNMHEPRDPFLPTRRRFLRDGAFGIGAAALAAHLRAGQPLPRSAFAWSYDGDKSPARQFAPRARSVIYLHMEGAPPTLDMFDPKPKLTQFDGKPCPDEFLGKERFAFIKGHPTLLGHKWAFGRHGRAGVDVVELLPNVAQVVDDLMVVKSMTTDQFNHAPAEFFLFTGSPRIGRPAMGAWAIYGLGSENRNLPGFVVLVSGGTLPSSGKSVWAAGFLPSLYQGVQLRSQGDPVLYLDNPDGMDRALRRRTLDAIGDLDRMHAGVTGNPETEARIAQGELAFRMQMSVPEAVDIWSEPEDVHRLYGTTKGQASLANNCLLARRLVERGVRFVQLYDSGWDIHGTSPSDDLITQFPKKCGQLDKALSGLITDLKRRGLLDETLVVWGGEFGRTPMNEARDGSKFFGRDHHPHCFTILMAGGGTRAGTIVGATDELGYQVVEDEIPVHDLQATIMALLGVDHEKLTYRFMGRDFRLTDVYGNVRRELIA